MIRQPREWSCSFFKDAYGKEPIVRVNLGEVWAGETKTLRIYLRNDEKWEVRDLTYEIAHPNVTIIGPDKLDSDEISDLTIDWSCTEDCELSLKHDLEIEGTLVVS